MPDWALVLQLADGDPLRAQEMEEKLSQRWWERGLIYRSELAQAQKDELRRLDHGKRHA